MFMRGFFVEVGVLRGGFGRASFVLAEDSCLVALVPGEVIGYVVIEVFAVLHGLGVPAAREPGAAAGLHHLRQTLSHFALHAYHHAVGAGFSGALLAAMFRGSPACACGASEGNQDVDVRGAGDARVEAHLFFLRDGDDHFVQGFLHLWFKARFVEMGAAGAPVGEALVWFFQALSALDVSARVILAP